MPRKETIEAIRRLAGVSPEDNLRKLVAKAREAYEQKRTKDCLDLIRAILLIDPDHATAQWMRSSIESEMQRDLEKTRAFRRKPQSKDSAGNHAETFRKHRLVLASVLIALGFVIAISFFFLSWRWHV